MRHHVSPCGTRAIIAHQMPRQNPHGSLLSPAPPFICLRMANVGFGCVWGSSVTSYAIFTVHRPFDQEFQPRLRPYRRKPPAGQGWRWDRNIWATAREMDPPPPSCKEHRPRGHDFGQVQGMNSQNINPNKALHPTSHKVCRG